MLADNFADVGRFHERFGLDNVTQGDNRPGPREWDDSLITFRTKFMQEELNEFGEGFVERDHTKMFDALLDLVYVALGTAHLLGYPWHTGWEEVHAANMDKERAADDGSNSTRGSSFDVIKPEGWTPPDIESILALFGFERS